MTKKNNGQPRLRSALVISSSIAVIAILISIIYSIYRNPIKVDYELTKEPLSQIEIKEETCNKLRFWSVVLNEWHDQGSLRTMKRVLKKMDFKFVNRSFGDDWDIFWSIEHPLGFYSDKEDISLYADIRNVTLEKHQKINHFPGIGILITKISMNENNRKSKYILPFFELPYDQKKLDVYLKENPDKFLLQKNYYNRGVKIVEAKAIKVDKSETFYQEFMNNHFLIDGHAFDFGVFVLITSFDPLRIYRYEADILLRFCPKPYHPFDKNDRAKYVVEDGCLGPYVMPTFKHIYENYGYSTREIYENYITSKGFNVDNFWRKIDDAIVSIILNSEKNVVNKTLNKKYSMKHFFEVVRFDFVLDSQLNPFVLEVNMSPNLTPAHKQFEENILLYEQLVFNTIKMIGGGSYHEFWARYLHFKLNFINLLYSTKF